jgi:translation initiation factor IF-1
MAGEESLRCEGIVVESLPNAMFRVTLEDVRRSSVTVHMSALREGEVSPPASGGERPRGVPCRLRPGDRVLVELSPYDSTRGRVVRKVE